MPDLIDDNKSIGLFDIIHILLKNMKIIIFITLIFMIGIVTISIISIKMSPENSFLPNVYSPKTLVMLNSRSGGVDSLFNNGSMGALASIAGISGGGNSGPSDSELAIKLATTNAFINKLNSKFNLDLIYKTKESSTPRHSLKAIINTKLKVQLEPTSKILEISYTDIDKKLATNIVNTATEILEEEFTAIDIIKNKNQTLLIEEKKVKVESEIERISKETIAFQKKHNLIDVDIVFDKLMEQMAQLQTDLLNKEIAIENYSMVSNIEDPGYKRLINERLAILNAIEKIENGEVGNFPPVRDLPELALELAEFKAEMAVQQAVYTGIIQQYEALKLTAEGTGPTFQVLEYAEIPEIKSGPSRGKLCILITFIGFFSSIFFIFIKEIIVNLKNDPQKMNLLRGKKNE